MNLYRVWIFFFYKFKTLFFLASGDGGVAEVDVGCGPSGAFTRGGVNDG